MRAPHSARRTLAAAAVAVVVTGALALPGDAGAMRHLRLLRSFPAKDTVLASSPDSVRLWLSEPPELTSTRVTLVSSSGRAVPLGKLVGKRAKGSAVSAAVQAPLAPGAYRLSWRTMSRDGHVVRDSFPFRVRATP